VKQSGGLVDRTGTLHVVVDIDGTRQTMRQRSVVSGADHPPVRRRGHSLVAPGYTGRKRGEGVRTRTVVQQAHTREWLGTFGHAGNGERRGSLERACQAVCAYALARTLAFAQMVLRLDGEHGQWSDISVIVAHALGYIVRCTLYSLLDLPQVVRVLAEQTPARFEQPETGTARAVYDVGWVAWDAPHGGSPARASRLIVTTRTVEPHVKVAVGKRRGETVYELFVTDRTSEALTACDVLSLYFARGGFEQTLSEEDREQDGDRWVSGNPHGQEFWQILAQWAWNLRLRLGALAQPPTLRTTLWSEGGVAPLPTPCTTVAPVAEAAPAEGAAAAAAPSDARATDAVPTPATSSDTASTPATPSAMVPAPATPSATVPAPAAPSATVATPATPSATMPAPAAPTAPLPARFTPADFLLGPDGIVRCPQGVALRAIGSQRHGHGQSVRFQAPVQECRACPIATRCWRSTPKAVHGRRVNLPACSRPSPPLPTAASRHGLVAPQGPPSPPHGEALASTPLAAPPHPVAAVTGPGPVLWRDLPATALRRYVSAHLLQHQVDLLVLSPPAQPSPPPWQTRAQRAHRRLSYEQRRQRNALPPHGPQHGLRLHGLPACWATFLGVPLR
jgi:hypothetical protein